jgi:hypothetical protein
VGDIHDGFVVLWSINPRTMAAKFHSSNKCTAFVHALVWMGNGSVVTVGVRHAKVWRPDQTKAASPSKSKYRFESETVAPSPSSKALPGRNCLLGRLLDSTFTCIASISDTKAVLGTDRGELCVLDDTDNSQKINGVLNVDFNIKSLAIHHERQIVWAGGHGEIIRAFSLQQLQSGDSTLLKEATIKPFTTTSTSDLAPSPGFLSIGVLATSNHLVTINSNREIAILAPEADQTLPTRNSRIVKLPAHSSAVLGVNIMYQHSLVPCGFLTWEVNGTVIFWSDQGVFESTSVVSLDHNLLSDDDEPNELRVVRSSQDGNFFVSGDKSGALRYVKFQATEHRLLL